MAIMSGSRRELYDLKMYLIYLFVCIYAVHCRPNSRDFYIKNGASPEHIHVTFDSFGSDGTASEPTLKVYVVEKDGDGKLEIVNSTTGPYVAVAEFKNKVNSTGWGLLKVTTNGSYPDLLQAEAAGMAEGFATADFISMSYQNTLASYCDNEKEYCDKLNTFLTNNNDWIASQIKANPKNNYWYQISLIYKQLEGMFSGYLASKVKPDITYMQFRYIQLSGDLEELAIALGKKHIPKVIGGGSCSAFIKLFPKNADLAISQVTWNDYFTMLRIYKLYTFGFHDVHNDTSLIKGAVQSFSSYPGVIFSADDFYILSSGMVTQETTIHSNNTDLMKYIQPNTVMEWVRTVVANRIASNGNEWCSIFEKANSGTYNNQWMVLDYKLFTPGKPMQPDTLWILEQVPGSVHMADMTVLLEQKGYWASYNLPFFTYVYNISGMTANKKLYGSWFDYDLNPRAQIFHRDQGNVIDMQSLVKLMRYNDYTKDPLSKCDACKPPYSADNAISARNELNPANGTYPFPALGHRRHGGTDVKATNSVMARKLSQFIAGGPTYGETLPPFQWSKTEWKRPLGHPDLFKFEPVLLDWKLEDWIVQPDVQTGPQLFFRHSIDVDPDGKPIYTVKKNNRLTTFPLLPKTYTVSFEMKFITTVLGGHVNVLHFTTGENYTPIGSRLPGLWFVGDALYAYSDINGIHRERIRLRFPTNQWVNIWFNYTKIGSDYYYIYYDGQTIYKELNRSPGEFKNVKLFASDEWYPPFNGEVRNLKVEFNTTDDKPASKDPSQSMKDDDQPTDKYFAASRDLYLEDNFE